MCILGTGAQWDILQVFAWGRMIACNMRVMSLQAAVEKTFDGHMCSVCRMVARAKREQQRSQSNAPEAGSKGKMLLYCHTPAPVIAGDSPGVAANPFELKPPADVWSKPPVPPPRSWFA